MKIFKYILLTFFIFIMIFTNIAFSDVIGDSFVTRDEYDLAIEEFNNRLNVFEIGINSKIDSQVTTYLDRYGIWSPTKQDINEAQSFVDCISTNSINNTSATQYGGDEKWGENYSYIDYVTKSGLLFGSYTWCNKSGVGGTDAKFGWRGTMEDATGGNWRSDLGMFFLVNIYETFSGVREKKYSCSLVATVGGVEDTNNLISHILACSIPSVPITNQFQFFVTKGSKITWEAECVYHFGQVLTCFPIPGDNATIHVEMKDGYVY